MFQKKLLALQYDSPTAFNFEDENHFRNLVYWLENMKIRFYPPDDRSFLQADSKNWNNSFEKYLNEINYTGSRTDKKVIIDWLLTLALRYESEDKRKQLNISADELCALPNSGVEFDLDYTSPEFLNELKDLCKKLDISFCEDQPLISLRAIAILVCKLRNLSRENSANSQDQSSECPKKKKIINKLDENILNMKYGKNSNYEKLLNRCANVLRLLYINDLRELQTDINNAIVQIQSVTANPKTDSTLGKVGK